QERLVVNCRDMSSKPKIKSLDERLSLYEPLVLFGADVERWSRMQKQHLLTDGVASAYKYNQPILLTRAQVAELSTKWQPVKAHVHHSQILHRLFLGTQDADLEIHK